MKRIVSIGMALVLVGLSVPSLTAADVGSAGDFASWDRFLRRYVRDGGVDYEAARRRMEDLRAAVREIETPDRAVYEAWTPARRKAFWINAYNIGAVKQVLEHYPLRRAFGLSGLRYPVRSIQQIPGVWDAPVLTLLGKARSLDAIENDVLRAGFRDPRVHFALVCASLGCPVLRPEAYEGSRLDAQLTDQIRAFASDPAKVRYDVSKDVLHLSPIFKWFAGDFQPEGGPIEFLRPYLPEGTARRLSGRTRIVWQAYDWSLNAPR